MFVFFHTPVPSEIYTLSLHDALPICGKRELLSAGGARRRADRILAGARRRGGGLRRSVRRDGSGLPRCSPRRRADRKSTRLNSSHVSISYAVFCLKKKK